MKTQIRRVVLILTLVLATSFLATGVGRLGAARRFAGALRVRGDASARDGSSRLLTRVKKMRRKPIRKYFSSGPFNACTRGARTGEKENPATRLSKRWSAALALQALPPLDDGDLVSQGFRWFVELLAGIDPLTFRALLKINLSGAMTFGILLWLWREGWRERIITIPVAGVCFFLGLWFPVAWIEIRVTPLKAFVVLLLLFGVIGLSIGLPFFFTRHARQQVKLRWIVFGTLAALVILQILLAHYGH